MSYYGLITFTFMARPVSYISIVRHLLGSGWDPGLIPNDDSFTVAHMSAAGHWERTDFNRLLLEDAFRSMELLESERIQFYVEMRWHDTLYGLTLFSDSEGRKLTAQLEVDRPELPGCEPYVDHSWYTPKLLIPLRELGCIVDVLEWDESP